MCIFNPSCTLTPNKNLTFMAQLHSYRHLRLHQSHLDFFVIYTARPGAISMDKSYSHSKRHYPRISPLSCLCFRFRGQSRLGDETGIADTIRIKIHVLCFKDMRWSQPKSQSSKRMSFYYHDQFGRLVTRQFPLTTIAVSPLFCSRDRNTPC